jgi:hypothetical protein
MPIETVYIDQLAVVRPSTEVPHAGCERASRNDAPTTPWTGCESTACCWRRPCFDCGRHEAEVIDGRFAPLDKPPLERHRTRAIAAGWLLLRPTAWRQCQPDPRRSNVPPILKLASLGLSAGSKGEASDDPNGCPVVVERSKSRREAPRGPTWASPWRLFSQADSRLPLRSVWGRERLTSR